MTQLILISLKIFTMLMLTYKYVLVSLDVPWSENSLAYMNKRSLLAADLPKNSCQNVYHKLFRHTPVLQISMLKGGDIRTLN